jgi:hypothetical protein
MTQPQPVLARRLLALRLAAAVAVVFGLVTLGAGSRVLLGADPGYVVYRPLLLYNTAMGLAYLAAGLAIWRSPRAGAVAGGTIFILNLLVLAGIVVLFARGGAVAPDSLRAMTLRTVVWLVLFIVAMRASGLRRAAGRTPAPTADRSSRTDSRPR